MTWNLSLKRANDHKRTTLVDLQKFLKPIEAAYQVERTFADQKKSIGGSKSRQYQDRGQGNCQSSNEGQTSGDKPCRKTWHNHKWKYFLDNRFGTNYQGNEKNANDNWPIYSNKKREVTYEDDNSCNLMSDKINHCQI